MSNVIFHSKIVAAVMKNDLMVTTTKYPASLH